MTTLNEKAVLVSISTKTWRAIVKDSTATEGTADLFDTTSDWVWSTTRIVDKAVINEPTQIAAAAKNYLYGKTPGPLDGKFLVGGLPLWSKGWHICPSALQETVLRNIGEFQSRFEAAVETVKQALPDALERARVENPKLHHGVSRTEVRLKSFAKVFDVETIIAEKYAFHRHLDLIPSAGDIRVEASKEFVADLKAEVETKASNKLQEVSDHCIATVVDVAKHLASSLSDYDSENKGKSPFRDSTLEKARDLVPVIRSLNVNGDARIDRIVDDLVSIVGNKSADDLRKDSEMRKSTGDAASKLANDIDSLFN